MSPSLLFAPLTQIQESGLPKFLPKHLVYRESADYAVRQEPHPPRGRHHSGEDFFHYAAVDVGETIIPALEFVRQPFMVDA